jgi:hypothetical protein
MGLNGQVAAAGDFGLGGLDGGVGFAALVARQRHKAKNPP